MNAAEKTAEIRYAARIGVAVQPFDGASMIAQTSETRATIDSPAPAYSSGGAAGSRDSGTSDFDAIRVPTTKGMLTRKTAPQEKWSRRKPPDTGPIAIPSPDTPAQIAIAFARSPAGKTFVRIESVDGMMNAAPTPIRARVEISAVAEPAKAEATDPAPKIRRPATSAFLRPKRSPSV